MADDSFRLDGKVAVVTGAGQGIGKACAMALGRGGATVAVTGLSANQADLTSVCKAITTEGGRAESFVLDVGDIPAVGPSMDRISRALGGLDILVNNAGVRANHPSLDLTERDWDHVIDVNLKGTFFCAQAAARLMQSAGGGRIINIASQLAVTAAPGRAAYIASKGGIVALTKTLAVEWAKLGINVNAVGPGPTDTPMTASSDATATAQVLSRSPIGRRLSPDEIAGAVVFLASPAATAVTGHHLLVDGGWTVS